MSCIKLVQVDCPLCNRVHECEYREVEAYTTFNYIPIKYLSRSYRCPIQVALGSDEVEWVNGKLHDENLLSAKIAYGQEIQKRENS